MNEIKTDAEAIALLKSALTPEMKGFLTYLLGGTAVVTPPAEEKPPVVQPPVTQPPAGGKTQAEISVAMAEAPMPRVSIPDIEVDPGQKFAYINVRLVDATGKLQTPTTSALIPVVTKNGSGTNYAYEGGQYSKVQKTLSFPAGGGAEQTVAIPIKGGPDGMWFSLVTPNTENLGVQPAITIGKITFRKGAVNVAVPLAPPPARSAKKSKLTFDLDIAKMKITPTGGAGIAATNLPGNMRTQPGNKEIGFYTDPTLHPGTKSYEIAGAELIMRAEDFLANRKFQLPNDPKSSVDTRYGASSIRLPSVNQLYGFFESDCWSTWAPGTWPAFWLMPADGTWPPELDVFEHWRNQRFHRGMTSATQHWHQDNKQIGGNIDLRELFGNPALDLTAGYSRYGLDWRADFTTWYIDDKEIFRSPTTFHKAAYPMWTIAVGAAAGDPDFSKGGAEMRVRSLKIWE